MTDLQLKSIAESFLKSLNLTIDDGSFTYKKPNQPACSERKVTLLENFAKRNWIKEAGYHEAGGLK